MFLTLVRMRAVPPPLPSSSAVLLFFYSYFIFIPTRLSRRAVFKEKTKTQRSFIQDVFSALSSESA